MATPTEIAAQALLDASSSLMSVANSLVGTANSLAKAAAAVRASSTPSTETPDTKPAVETQPVPETKPPVVTNPPAPTGGVRSLSLSGVQSVGDEFTGADVNSIITSGKYQQVETKHPDLISLDSKVKFNGHNTLKMSQPGGEARQPKLVMGFAPTTKVAARLDFLLSKGWQARGTGLGETGKPEDASVKLTGFGFGNFYGRLGVHTAGGNGVQLFVDPMPAKAGQADPAVAVYATNLQNPKSFTLFSLGAAHEQAWHELIVVAELVNDNDVHARLYVGPSGGTPVLVGDLVAALDPGAEAVRFNTFFLLQNFNQVRLATQHQAIWLGRAEVVDLNKVANPFKVPGF